MTWTSETVVSKLYETVDTTQRFDGQRLEQWLSVLRRRTGDEVFAALIGVFGSVDRPQSRYLDQEYAGELLAGVEAAVLVGCRGYDQANLANLGLQR